MSRSPVTIAILAWNSWETTRACLDSLRPTLGIRDQVVVVDNGSEDATPNGLRLYPWIDVVTNAQNRGFAGGCNDGAAAARHDVVIFLNNDTILSNGWIDPLAAAFEDSTVGAAGSRSNFVSGPQVVEGATYDSMAEMRRFAKEWVKQHRGQTSEIDRLVGFCIAVRRSAFEAIGGFDEGYGIGGYEDDDLCQRLRGAGFRLVVCHDSFVHHDGHKTFDANGLDWFAEQQSNRDRFMTAHLGSEDRPPLVSACMITKDEEARLGGCLESLKNLVDEIVIYDTGSSDGTVELARSLGATVIEGYWDDDFSRARNAALEHCRGDWIAWFDADETLVCDDPTELRHLLAMTKPEIDAWSTPIHNLTGAGTGSSFLHHASRLFRRAQCEWTGRLHEQVAKRGDHAPIQQALLETASIRHTGYLDEMMIERGKAERNLRVAQAEVDEDEGWDKGYSLSSLSRSLLLAGRFEEGYQRGIEALDCTDNVITRRLALRTVIDALIGLNRTDEALEWCDRLRAESDDPHQADGSEAAIRLVRGENEAALALLDRLKSGLVDGDGFSASAARLAAQRAAALAALGRFSEAADALLGSMLEEGALDTHLGDIVDYLTKAGRPLTDLAQVIPEDKSVVFLAQVLQLQLEPADATLEACLAAMANTKAVLATASTLATRLPVDRSLVWSARLRAAGWGRACPLMAIARADGYPVVRARAAATALRAFGDPGAEAAFWAAYEAATDLQRAEIRTEAAQLCPELATAALA